jgi:uncharacterized protein YbcI
METQKDFIEDLAGEILKAWQAAHGVNTGKASLLVGPNQIAVLIEEAFSKAEKKLAEGQTGKELLRKYSLELLNQICTDMKVRIESAVGSTMKDSDVIANPDADQVMFVFKFTGHLSAGASME